MPPGVGYFDRWLDVMVSVCIVGGGRARARPSGTTCSWRRLHAEARIDPLTGLLNRRGFDERVAGRAGPRPPEPATRSPIVSFDIDHFKRINDAAGHEAGDRVLIRVAAVLREHARAATWSRASAARSSSSLLPESDAAEAAAFAERIRDPLSHRAAGGSPRRDRERGSRRRAGSLQSAALLRASDAALYEAKQAGRNRVVAASADPAVGRPAA